MENKETKLCQSCGMPLDSNILGSEANGTPSPDYCIYCYNEGAFTGDFTMEEMVEFCSMYVQEYNKSTGQNLTCCQYKDVLRKLYPTLKRWNLPKGAVPQAQHPLKKAFISEVNALGIDQLHITNLYVLLGSYINQPYNINGNSVRLLSDSETYWCNQLQKSDGRCYGIACCEQYILVSEYGIDGSNAELIILKRR